MDGDFDDAEEFQTRVARAGVTVEVAAAAYLRECKQQLLWPATAQPRGTHDEVLARTLMNLAA